MRVVFMGTPAFAVPSLELLVRRHEVILVITRPDAASGRGTALRPSPVKTAALRAGLHVLEAAALRDEPADVLRHLAPDVICVAAFGLLLPPEVLTIPRHGCINVHASLLPRHRGAAPVQRAVLEGDGVTGVSIMLMEQGLDTGPYAAQRRVPVDDRYAEELEDTLAHAGAQALLDVLERIELGSFVWSPQDHAHATYAPKVTKDDVALLPDLTVAQAFARVRAATRRAPARACVGNRDLTVVRARPAPEDAAPGAVCLAGDTPILGFSDGALALEVVRPSGRKDMPGHEWARGARLEPEVCWRCTR